jgi:hypothetical protein
MKDFKNEIFEYWFEDEILFARFLKPTEINLEIGTEFLKTRLEISNDNKQYWCYDISNVKSMTKESRDHSEREGQEGLHACAVIVNSHLTKFIFNIFFKLKSIVIPFKSFVSKEEAVSWLKSIKNQNEKILETTKTK